MDEIRITLKTPWQGSMSVIAILQQLWLSAVNTNQDVTYVTDRMRSFM